MQRPKTDFDRHSLPRSEKGSGLVQLELTDKTTTIFLQRYPEITED